MLNIKNNPENIVFLDIETTGFSSESDEIIQISTIKTINLEIIDKYSTFISIKGELPKHINELTGITKDDCKGGKTIDEAIEELQQFIDGCYICAHNAFFDYEFLTKAGLNTDYTKSWIDTLALARIAYPELKEHNLEHLAKDLEIHKSTHNAVDDAKSCFDIYKSCVDRLGLQDKNILRTQDVVVNRFRSTLSIPFKQAIDSLGNQNKKDYENSELLNEQGIKGIRARNISSLQSKAKENKKRASSNNIFDVNEAEDDSTKQIYKYPDSLEIEEYFKENGILNRHFDNYEFRAGQLEFAQRIIESAKNNSILVCEAETGIGKTFSYLVTSILFSLLNGEPVGVSSNTNTLIDQLINKDLPAISDVFDKDILYCSLKGISHYICLRKFTFLLNKYVSGNIVKSEKSSKEMLDLLVLLSFIGKTEYEDIDDLQLNFGGLYKNQFTCESNECFKSKCPFYRKYCYTHGNRELAASANIVVTNHSMLFNNCAAEGAILPTITTWIVDEAHNCEEWARHAFTHELSTNSLKAIVEKSADSAKNKCVLSKTVDVFTRNHSEMLFFALTRKGASIGNDLAYKATELAESMVELSELLPQNAVVNDSEEIWISDDKFETMNFSKFVKSAKEFLEVAKKQHRVLGELLNFLEDYSDVSTAQAELTNYRNDINEAICSLSAITKPNNNTHVISTSIPKKDSNLPYVVSAQPLDIAHAVNKNLLQECKNVVFTSATLTVNNTFKIFEDSLGITEYIEQGGSVEEMIIKSPFNFDENMQVLVLQDMVEPQTKTNKLYSSYINSICDFLARCIEINGGSCLVLFANIADMKECFRNVEKRLNGQNLELIFQNNNVSKQKIISRFVENEASTLFATKSFWEGVDAPGDTLRCVIIVKFPFTNMSDPLYKKLNEMQGFEAFRSYSLPKAIIQTKQACGRLIRSSSDKGFVVIADSRAITKGYGVQFLNSLQSENIRKTTMEDALSIIKMA